MTDLSLSLCGQLAISNFVTGASFDHALSVDVPVLPAPAWRELRELEEMPTTAPLCDSYLWLDLLSTRQLKRLQIAKTEL